MPTSLHVAERAATQNTNDDTSSRSWKVIAAWLVLVVLALAIMCAAMGSPLAGTLLSGVCLLVVLFLLVPPLYNSTPGTGAGKWVYGPNGAVRFDPNMVAHAEANAPNMSPRACAAVKKQTV